MHLIYTLEQQFLLHLYSGVFLSLSLSLLLKNHRHCKYAQNINLPKYDIINLIGF